MSGDFSRRAARPRDGLLALLLLPALAAAQEGPALPRKIEFLVPEGTFLVARARGMNVDLPGLLAAAGKLLDEGAPLHAMLDPKEAREATAGLRFVRGLGLERGTLGTAIAELARGEVLFGLRHTGRPRPFVIARVRDSEAARRVEKPFARLFKLPVERHGPLLWIADGRAALAAVEKAVAGVTTGAGPTALARRVAKELTTDAPLAAWLDLSATGPGKGLRQRLRRVPQNATAAFFAGGLGPTIAGADSLVAEARLDWDDVRLEVRAPQAIARMPKWARDTLGLDEPAMPALPELPGTLARFRLSRSLAKYLQHKDHSAGKGAQKDIQGFLAGLEMFFRGARVEEDVLPDLISGFSGIVTTPRKEDKAGHPYRIPTGAVVMGLQGRRLVNSVDAAAQVIYAITRNERQRNGKLQYRLKARKEDGIRFQVMRLSAPTGGRPWPVDSVFGPVFARSPKHLAFGFSKTVCKELLTELRDMVAPAGGGRRALDMLDVRFDRVAASIQENRALIESRLLVENGYDFDRSTIWVDALSRLVRMAGRATVEAGQVGKDWYASLHWRPDLDAKGGDR